LELCIEENSIIRKKLESNFGVRTSERIVPVIQGKCDLVIVATPTETHLDVVSEVLEKMSPKVILLEKPAAASMEDVLKICKLSVENKVPIILNYPRRYSVGAKKVKELISSYKMETPAQGIVWFGNDILNSGIHFLDLIEYWFGELSLKKLDSSHDCNSTFRVSNEDIQMTFLSNESIPYTHFSLEILFQNGRLEMGPRDFGFRWHPVTPDKYYEGHFVVSEEFTKYEMGLNHLQNSLLERLSSLLEGDNEEIYLIENSLNNYKMIFKALESNEDLYD
jgi:predicted dehydrogenase